MRRNHLEQSKAHWTPIPTPEQRAAELAREERLVAGDIRQAFIRTLAGCFAWVCVGLGPMAWAFHTTDPARGQIALLLGLVLGYSGIVFTLARYYLKGEKSGWW